MKSISLLLILFFYGSSHAQKLSKTLTKTPVKSVYWGSRSVVFIDGFLEMVDKELQKQFTKTITDSLIRYSETMYQPRGWEDTTYRNSLKLYHVATFDNNFNGKFWGKRYIVMVPYAENKFIWKFDKTTPNDFFLIFPADAIELAK